jgi:hypothetical protein
MAIHEGTTIAVAPRISKTRFAAILRERGSPAADEAEAGWAAVKGEGVDPLFALAIFHQESQFATDAASATVQSALRNPGHTRSSRTGVGSPVETAFGPFIRYPSWAEGWRDLAFRLVDPDFVYAQEGRRTIRPIIERWAPPDDTFDIHGLNNTDRYVANVVRNMTEWGDEVACTPSPPPPFDGADKRVGDVVFHAARQTVESGRDGLRRQQFAFAGSCETQPALRKGETFAALYWVEGDAIDGERRWWVDESGSRIWAGGTVQQPGETG